MNYVLPSASRPHLLLALLMLSVGSGCDRPQSGRPRIQLVQVGMTVQQVERALGKPVTVHTMPPSLPGMQLREYPGDGDKRIFVGFKNGVVVEVNEFVPRHNWPPVG